MSWKTTRQLYIWYIWYRPWDAVESLKKPNHWDEIILSHTLFPKSRMKLLKFKIKSGTMVLWSTFEKASLEPRTLNSSPVQIKHFLNLCFNVPFHKGLSKMSKPLWTSVKLCLFSVSSNIKILIKICWNGETDFPTTSDRHDTALSYFLKHYRSQAPAPDEKQIEICSCTLLLFLAARRAWSAWRSTSDTTNEPTHSWHDARSAFGIGEMDGSQDAHFILW